MPLISGSYSRGPPTAGAELCRLVMVEKDEEIANWDLMDVIRGPAVAGRAKTLLVRQEERLRFLNAPRLIIRAVDDIAPIGPAIGGGSAL